MFFTFASFALLTVAPVWAQTSVMVATPTIPTSVTSARQISSVLATASTSPNLGTPASLNNYPLCAQICNNETLTSGLASGDYNDLRNLCGPEIRGLTSGCQAATCDAGEQNRTNILASQLCGSLYNANATYSSQVSVAIASSTAAAIAATRGKDPLKVSDFPKCAQSCITQNNYNGCGAIIPLSQAAAVQTFSVRRNPVPNSIRPSRLTLLTRHERPATLYLAEVLCEPVGGILTRPINYTSAVRNGTVRNGTNTTVGAPAPSPFRGAASQERSYSVASLIMTGLAVAVAMLML
ncbi:MAG: hypothetical protein Q9182_001821 [Xanthomendoza sp. 2 TL-2023]